MSYETVVLDATTLALDVLEVTRRVQAELIERIGERIEDPGAAEDLLALDRTCTHVALAADAARRLLEGEGEAFTDLALVTLDDALTDARDAFDDGLPGEAVNAAFDRLTEQLEALSDGEGLADRRFEDAAPEESEGNNLQSDAPFKFDLDKLGDIFKPSGRGTVVRGYEIERSAPPPEADDRPAALIQHIFLGTDREPDPKAVGGFGKGRAQKLTLAEVQVSVPTARKRGTIPRPGRFLFWSQKADPDRHIIIAEDPVVMDEAAFLAALKGKTGDGAGFLFIHGYNSPFANGLYRTAQLAVDLEIKGPVFHYSWPSAGDPVFYDYDDVSARVAKTYFAKFLELIVDRAKITTLNIIAHSKGNDLMLDTMELLAQRRASLTDGELVMASADADCDRAEDVIPQIRKLFGGITLYANAHDRPLMFSTFKAKGPRAGGLMRDGAPLIVDGADTIDAGGQEFAWFGLNHDAYVSPPLLRNDIRALFEYRTRPVHERTPSLRLQTSPRTPFWRPDED